MTETTQTKDPIDRAIERFTATVDGIRAELARKLEDPATHPHAYAWATGAYEGAILTLRAEVGQ